VGYFGAATADKHHRQPSRLPDRPNLLDRSFTATGRTGSSSQDITYVETDQGWLYLATVLDHHSRKIVGWATWNHLRADLPWPALDDYLGPAAGRRPYPSFRSRRAICLGRVSQCDPVRRLPGLDESQSRLLLRCSDGELFHTLKTEFVHRRQCTTRAEATRDIFAYIKCFYNRPRRHSAIC